MNAGVGVEFRDGTVNVAVVRGGKAPKLQAFVLREVPPPAEGETREDVAGRALREIWEEHELAGYPVVASLDAKDCILRQIVVPFTQDEKIRRVIRFEAENYLHACAVDNVVVDFIKVDELAGKSGILLTAGRKDVIRVRLDTLQRGGVDPEILDLDVVALYNAFSRSPQFRTEGTVIVIDMGAESVRLLLIRDGALKKVRSFRVQGAMAAAVPADRQLTAPETAGRIELPLAHGDPLNDLEASFAALEGEFATEGQDVPIAVLEDGDYSSLSMADMPEPGPNGANGDVGPLLDRIFGEAQRTFASAVLREGVDLVCLTGSGSRLEEAANYFTEGFGAETVLLDLGDMVEPNMADDDESPSAEEHGAVAVGLALRAAGETTMGLDFRRESFRYEQRFARLRIPLLFTGALLFVGLLLNCLYLTLDRSRHEEDYQSILAHQRNLYQVTFGEKAKTAAIKNEVVQRYKKLQGLIGQGGGVPEFLPILKLLKDLGDAVKKTPVENLVWMRVQLKTEIPKTASRATSRTGVSAGQISILWDPDPETVSKVEKAINDNSVYVKVLTYRTETDRSSGRTVGKFDLQFRPDVLEKFQKKPAAKRGVPGGRRTTRGR